jgi:hypothetical protein
MADRWQGTTDGYPFRFFSPGQVDQILRDGTGRGRGGSHAAIERILKHEPGLSRTDLWQRIRQVKYPTLPAKHSRSVWNSEDEKTLREGYQAGWQGKREAVRQLLKRHPDWRPHVIWKRAARLCLVQSVSRRGQDRSRSGWSEDDDRILLNLAGYKPARVIAKLLHRSEAAVRYRLARSDKSSRVHLEGYARSALARELHLASNTLRRFIAEGLLQVRDPRITRESIERLHRSGRLDELRMNGVPATAVLAVCPSTFGKLSRAKRAWAEVASTLSVTAQTVEKLIARGVLKLYDPRITEKSLRDFCRCHGALINSDLLNRETRDWLQSTMDFVPRAGEAVARGLTPLRKHACVIRQCQKCGRSIRGNVFFKHAKRCKRAKLEAHERHNSDTTKPNPPEGVFS